jgi:hypothetical protein
MAVGGSDSNSVGLGLLQRRGLDKRQEDVRVGLQSAPVAGILRE